MEYALGFVILLGVLITIHEFGHFIIAKACGVRVEVFSIGFGKKILKWTRGETQYTVSLIPFGGYVKLTGQDPREEVPKELENRSFRGKPLWQKAAVVLAGPLFNAGLALILYIFLVGMGLPVHAPTINRVLADSPAEKAGFRSADKVTEIKNLNTNEVFIPREFTDLGEYIAKSVNQNLEFSVKRHIAGQDYLNDDSWQKDINKINFSPKLGLERHPSLGVMEERGVIPGVERQDLAAVFVVQKNSWLAKRYLPNVLLVEKISMSSDKTEYEVNTQDDFARLWKKAATSLGNKNAASIVITGKALDLSGEQVEGLDNESQRYELNWFKKSDSPFVNKSIEATGFFSSELLVSMVLDSSPAQKMGLKSGDLITKLNGKRIHSFKFFVGHLQELAGQNQKLTLEWLRKGAVMSGSFEPELREATDNVTQTTSKRFQIGAAFKPFHISPAMTKLKADSFLMAVSLGWKKCAQMTTSMLKSFAHIFTGRIALKTLGGFISIGKYAGESYKRGIVPFLNMMALISLNLFILNLLPLPVLDGGHLVLFLIEAVLRKPLNIKIIEVWSTVGIVMLLGLMLFVTYNDITRHILPIFDFFK